MRYLIITFITLLIIVPTQNSLASTYSEELVVEGRVLLFDSNNIPPNPTYSGLVAANEKFLSAVAADSTDPLANLFYAVTRIMVTYIEQGDTVGIETVRELLEAFGFTRSLEDSMDLPAYNDPPEINGVYAPPTSTPSGEEFQTFLAGDFLALIESAIVNLNVITSSFTATLTPAETGDIFPIEIDYGDVLFYKSILHTLRAFIQIVSAYDMDINLRDSIILANADVLQIQRDLLDKYNDFLSLHTDGASQLTSARTTLLLAIDTYRAAFTFITSETDNQDDDLISFGSEEEVAEASTALAVLTEMQNSVIANRPYTETEEDWILTIDGIDEMELDFTEDYSGNFVEGSLTDNSGFYGWVNDITVVGSTITVDVGFIEEFCPASVTLTGTLSGASITGGTYNVVVCSNPADGGTFIGTRQSTYTETPFDLNYLFGNTGKSPLNIRGILPGFDTDWDMIAGTFPPPYLNNIIPGISTELQLVNELELPVVYDVQLGTITLDGNGGVTEWPDSLAVAEDDVNDAYMYAAYGNDISRLYAARDSNSFYWMMKLNDPPVHNDNYYGLQAYGRTNNKIVFSNVYNGTYDLYAYDFWTYVPISSDPKDMGVGNVIEARIPIEQFDGTVKIDVDSYSYGDFIGDVMLRFPNDADLSGSVSCDSFDGNGKIFIYVYDGSNPATSRLLGTAVLESPGGYTVTGLPIGKEVYVSAHWDADDNGIRTYGDFIKDSGNTPVEILAVGTSSNISITTEIISPLLNGGIIAENRAYSEFFTNYNDYYEMRGWAKSKSKSLPIYAQNIPHSSGAIQAGIPYLSKLDLLSPPNYTFSRKFSAGQGFSLPGIDWEGGTFPIYIDENLNGVLDLGEASIEWTIPEGSLQQLSIPEVSITGRLNPTITWQEVPEAERYSIRLWTVTEENGLGDVLGSVNINANGSPSYSYTYDGDLFSQYSTLAVTVMANDTDSGFYNRSTYVTTHSTTVNLPGVMLLLLD